ncbi:hypothetical protein bcgnr5384_48510 [Bacillus cereus]
MDPLFGSGAVSRVAIKHNRNFIGIELNLDYIEISDRLLSNVQLELINHF